MSWWSRLIGRSEPMYDDGEGEGFTFAAAPAGAVDNDGGFPAFRNPGGYFNALGHRGGAAERRALIREAFRPSQPVSERAMFAGRRDLVESLIVAIEDQRLHFVLYGDRGIGKTSILRLLQGLATDAGYLICYISCGEDLKFDDVARRVGRLVPLLHHRQFAPGAIEIEQGRSLEDILGPEPVTVSAFGEQLSMLANTQVIIMLDEFDRVASDDFRKAIAELIKILSDNSAPAQLIIAGVAADLTELVAQIPSIRRNVIGVSVPNMSEDEVGEMLEIANRRSGVVFTPDARELIELASLGLPYLVGLIGQHAALQTASNGGDAISKSDVRAAIVAARGDLARRISTHTLTAIRDAIARDELNDLGKLAHVNLRSGGLLPEPILTDNIRASLCGGDATILPLLERVENDSLNRWRFIDDGAAVYIWLTALSET